MDVGRAATVEAEVRVVRRRLDPRTARRPDSAGPRVGARHLPAGRQAARPSTAARPPRAAARDSWREWSARGSARAAPQAAARPRAGARNCPAPAAPPCPRGTAAAPRSAFPFPEPARRAPRRSPQRARQGRPAAPARRRRPRRRTGRPPARLRRARAASFRPHPVRAASAGGCRDRRACAAMRSPAPLASDQRRRRIGQRRRWHARVWPGCHRRRVECGVVGEDRLVEVMQLGARLDARVARRGPRGHAGRPRARRLGGRCDRARASAARAAARATGAGTVSCWSSPTSSAWRPGGEVGVDPQLHAPPAAAPPGARSPPARTASDASSASGGPRHSSSACAQLRGGILRAASRERLAAIGDLALEALGVELARAHAQAVARPAS